MIELEEALNQGDLNILNAPNALSVVGAQDALPEELAEVQSICEDAANNNVLIISGGARGVDSTATDAALKASGKAVIFPSDGLPQWQQKEGSSSVYSANHVHTTAKCTFHRFLCNATQ